MKKKCVLSILLIICIICISVCGLGNVNSDIAPVSFNGNISKYLRDSEFTGSVMIVSKDKILYAHGFGKRNSVEEMSPETVMEIGSLTKQMTAAAILELCEEGEISEEDTLDIYFPEYKYGKEITIRNLLTMTSEIKEYMSDPDILSSNPLDVIMEMEWSKTDLGKESYSNSNYYLLGKIIEQCSGTTYEEYMKEHYFTPMGLINTSISICENVNPVVKKGNMVSYPIEYTFSTGGVSSNLYDLYQWEKAYWNGEILSDEYFKELCNTKEGYLYGWNCEENQYYHEGETYSFHSAVYYDSEEDVEIMIISNNIDTECRKLINKMHEITIDYLKK